MSRKSVVICLVLSLLLAAGTAVNAQQIGPGASTMGASADGGGGRTNIERDFVTLPAGTYNVLDFDFWGVNTSGTVQPFLSAQTTPPGGQRYTPVWVGPTVAPAVGTNLDTYALASQTFTLASDTDVYAGFVMTENAVGFFGGGLTDHNGAPPLAPVVGVELPVFSNNNLGRTYSFAINVEQAVPEPASIAIWSLLGLAAAGFFAYRRRRSV